MRFCAVSETKMSPFGATRTIRGLLRPDANCFTVNPAGNPSAILEPRYHHRAYGVPDDVITIPAGGSYSITCDLNEMFDPEVLTSGSAVTYEVQATYLNHIDPNGNLFTGAITSAPATVIVEGDPVTQTEVEVAFDPNIWVQQWANFNSPTIKAHITNIPSGVTSVSGVMLNGCEPTVQSSTSVSAGSATVEFDRSRAVQCLGTGTGAIPLGNSVTLSTTVQGTLGTGAVFTGQGQVQLLQGLSAAIDIKPDSRRNTINLNSRGAVPVAILSSPTFDARTVDPLTVTLAGAKVKLKPNGKPKTSVEDVNDDGRKDLVVHVITQQLQLQVGDTSAELEGTTFSGIPIIGSDKVRVVRKKGDDDDDHDDSRDGRDKKDGRDKRDD